MPTEETRAICVWFGRENIHLIDFWGSLNISILMIVLPGDNGGDAVGLEPREARQEDVKTGVTQSQHS